TGAADGPADPPEPWPTQRDLPPVPASADGRGAQREARRGRRRSAALTAALVLAAVAAVGVLVVATSDGRTPSAGGTPQAARAALPTTGGAGTSAPATRPRGSASPGAAHSHAPAVPTSAAASVPASATPAASASPAATDGTLRPGDSGPAVARLQQLLFQQGFTYVSVTGVYDTATTRGVTQLQQDRGITGDPAGVYGPASRAALDPGN
ncbi:peptidoglycan-binding domain-containing protein, partial [Streptacidiphilus jiangxiensis]